MDTSPSLKKKILDLIKILIKLAQPKEIKDDYSFRKIAKILSHNKGIF